MSLRAQLTRLSLAGAAMRQEMFGSATAPDYDNGTPAPGAYFVPVKFDYQLQELNLREAVSTIVRIPRATCTFTPQKGKIIRFPNGGPVVRIADVPPTHPASTEWVLGCTEP